MKKIYNNFNAKLGALLKQYGIKLVGGWAITQEHVTIMIFDVPDARAMMKFMSDPETGDWQSYQLIKTRPLVTLEEAIKMLK